MGYEKDIMRLRAEGKTYDEIKKILGCSKGTISYHLGMGQKEKTLLRTNNRRTDIIKYLQEYKQSRPCIDCGENYPYWMKDFDHLGNKSFNISSFRNNTSMLSKVKLEIEKCEIVCANCHRNRTFLRNITKAEGTLDVSSYYLE